MKTNISRRDFMKGAVAGALSLSAAGILGACSTDTAETPETEASTKEAIVETEAEPGTQESNSTEPVLTELAIPEAEAPAQTEYSCDVLVVGGGFAGLFAALEAKEAGADVLLVDKGRPGYSGLSAWASSHCYFDADLGDSKENFEYAMKYANEWICNMNWVDKWIEESKSVYEKCVEMGVLNQYATAAEEGYWVDGSIENDKLVDYHLAHLAEDRRPAFINALNEAGIPFVERCMVMDIVEDGGRVVGAMGLDVMSGTVMTFHAKSVILATGTGSYKPAGFPTAGDTFDGEYIGFTHGLPLTGQEFEDFHMSASFAPGNVLACNSWQYLESVWLCAPGGSTPENAAQNALGAANSVILPVFQSAVDGVTKIPKGEVVYGNSRGASSTGVEGDPRGGKQSSGVFKGDVFGAAPGMYSHYAGGIFCGIDDVEGKTAIEGLWVAGDGTNGCMSTGGTKSAPSGWTSNFAGVQGKVAGAAAAAYAASAEEAVIPADQIAAQTEEILAPMSVETGFDPNWARDVLVGIMAPYWVSIAKNGTAMEAALAQVVQFRNEVIPKLRATNGHELRLCHEMKHKALIAEAKLRASLERKESRGYHYRTDYPYRDDEYLCYITVQQTADGGMDVEKVDIKDEWKGDTSADYTERYATWRFPGEQDALNLPDITLTTSWGH